jgi:preprotein translocase subunit YajC
MMSHPSAPSHIYNRRQIPKKRKEKKKEMESIPKGDLVVVLVSS